MTRENAGYRQQFVAAVIGLSNHAQLSRWENERMMPSATILMKLCALYRRSPQELYPEYWEYIQRGFIDLT